MKLLLNDTIDFLEIVKKIKTLGMFNTWFNKKYSAMNYNFTIDYKKDPMVSIDAMTISCQYCLALI